MSWASCLLVYLLGCLTLPAICTFLIWSFTRQHYPTTQSKSTSDNATNSSQSTNTEAHDQALSSYKASLAEPPTAAGYFAVCREYTHGGINARPIERSTPTGQVPVGASTSVYQSMYKSIFDRNKSQPSQLDADKKDPRQVKRAKNVFYVVLRHDHLLLFDTADQLEIRHVISLSHHTIDLYAGGEPMTEGDLFIKRHCIRLSQSASFDSFQAVSKPFYLFSDNCHDKEDFYHALLAAQSTTLSTDPPSPPKHFDPAHMIKLVQSLHTSDADPQLKWLNALVGRIFLGLYNLPEIEDLVKAKLMRKIARVPKPTFIPSVAVQSVSIGDAAPVFSNFKFKELNIDGDVTLEADVKYNGGFRLEVAAVVRIDLGQRFRAREVDLLLAVVLRRLSGHLLIKIKPPPSNRIWIAFDHMPQLDMTIEPVVSTRQITYGVILRAIESRIREVLGETLVLPNWDDVPFLDTLQMAQRGGIWQRPVEKGQGGIDDTPDSVSTKSATLLEPTLVETDTESTPDTLLVTNREERSMSVPLMLTPSDEPQVKSRKPVRRKAKTDTDTEAISSSSSIASIAANKALSSTNNRRSASSESLPTLQQSTERRASKEPKSLRLPSVGLAASPVVNTDDARPAALRTESSDSITKREAVDYVKEVKDRNDRSEKASSPLKTESGDVLLDSSSENDEGSMVSDAIRITVEPAELEKEKSDTATSVSNTLQDRHPIPSKTSKTASALSSTISLSTAAAKQWSWNVLKQTTNKTDSSSLSIPNPVQKPSTNVASSTDGTSFSKTFAHMRHASDNSSSASPIKNGNATSMPMGRGQPLPAPGTPLPGPSRASWTAPVLGIASFKKKASTLASGAGSASLAASSAAGSAATSAAGTGSMSGKVSAVGSEAPKLPARSSVGRETLDTDVRLGAQDRSGVDMSTLAGVGNGSEVQRGAADAADTSKTAQTENAADIQKTSRSRKGGQTTSSSLQATSNDDNGYGAGEDDMASTDVNYSRVKDQSRAKID